MKPITPELLEKRRRRYLRRLAETLTYKADVYGPTGRIFSHQAKWKVIDGRLLHGDIEYQPEQLTDGHGRQITDESSY